MKKTRLLSLFVIVAMVLAVSCGKKSNDANTTAPAPVQLTGTPAQNMITVMEMGVNALKNNSDAAVAASALKKIMADYNIEQLRAASKAAKDAGQGATDEEKARFQSLQDEYKALATQVGSQNLGAFNEAHADWSRAWGIN